MDPSLLSQRESGCTSMAVTNNSRGAYTSGRYVYSYGRSTGIQRWYWQCDLHGDEYAAHPDPEWEGDPSWHGPDEGYDTHSEALDAAFGHAFVCGQSNYGPIEARALDD